MTVRDAQERAVGSSVRECRCIRSGPGIRMLMENGKKSVLSWSEGSDLTTVFGTPSVKRRWRYEII